MSVSGEIDLLERRAQSISGRGYRRHWLIVYAEGLKAKIEQAEFALDELTKIISQIGNTVSATSPNAFLPGNDVYFYSDGFWAFVYSTLDVLAQVLNQALKLGIDEEDVSFGRLNRELEQHPTYAGTAIQKRVHECKVSRPYHWLRKYRNCSIHRRRVYIGREAMAVGTPEYHRASSTGKITVGAYSVGKLTLCDDPYELKMEMKRARTIPEYMHEIKFKVLEHIEKILKATNPVR